METDDERMEQFIDIGHTSVRRQILTTNRKTNWLEKKNPCLLHSSGTGNTWTMSKPVSTQESKENQYIPRDEIQVKIPIVFGEALTRNIYVVPPR